MAVEVQLRDLDLLSSLRFVRQTATEMDDPSAPKFGLPPCLWVPIAAASVEAIEKFVGKILARKTSRAGRVGALLLDTPRIVSEHPAVELWRHPARADYRTKLFPSRQVWVHVDYAGYRRAYIEFGMPALTPGHFLDHIQNREAIRLRDYSHPYLRLCPVSRVTNTSGGHSTGGEGMEKAFVRTRMKGRPPLRKEFRDLLRYQVQYADPMDLTKMLDIAPGTETLPGVAEVQHLFFPS